MKKSILILSFGPIHNDPRIIRQVEALKDDYEVTTAGFTSNAFDGVINIILDEDQTYKEIDFYYKYPIIIRKFFSFTVLTFLSIKRIIAKVGNYRLSPEEIGLKRFLKKDDLGKISKHKYDLIISNDIFALPLAVSVKQKYNKTKIYFDAHEYHQEEREHDKYWVIHEKPLVNLLFRKFISYVDIMSTVSDPIAERYSNELKIPVKVITNAPFYKFLEPKSNSGKIKLVHHGKAAKDRMLESTFGCIEFLDPENYELHIILVPDKEGYMQELKNKYHKMPNVFWHDPVPTEKIPEFINQFDIGIYILPPVNFNNENALPNKFFEFIQARLAIVTTPNPAMKEIILEYNLGKISDDYTSKALANTIASISKVQINLHKQNSHTVSKDLSAENNMVKIRELIFSVI